jgi:flavin reductase
MQPLSEEASSAEKTGRDATIGVPLSQDFKQAMRRLATTVALVTSGRDESWAGMTATAVMSACADPPTLVVAVNRNAGMHPKLHREQRFCVNLLAGRHRELVADFSGAKKGLARFEKGQWIAGEEGIPVLSDALASLTCRIQSTVDVGTHTLFIGLVESVIKHNHIDPLLWVDGGVATLTR